MEPAPPPRPLDPDASSCRPTTTKTLSFPNGTIKKHHHLRPPPPPPPPAADTLYRECLKNHAASLGGHALDGCGEFMPSPVATPSDPTSLKCAACGCHRNFHRRLPDPLPHASGVDEMHGVSGDGDSDGDDQMEEEEKEGDVPVAADGQNQSSSSPPPFFSSAPHMLLALSAGLGANPPRPPAAAAPAPRKRFRSRFSPAQKGRMQELSVKLGWKMQKRDEGLVEEWCREIGVSKGVFKVWMHNNKHNFVPGSSRRGEIGGGAAAAGEGNSSGALQGVNSHMVNGSSSS